MLKPDAVPSINKVLDSEKSCQHLETEEEYRNFIIMVEGQKLKVTSTDLNGLHDDL